MKKKTMIYLSFICYIIIFAVLKQIFKNIDVNPFFGSFILFLKLLASVYCLILAIEQFVYFYKFKMKKSTKKYSIPLGIAFFISFFANLGTGLNSLIVYGYKESLILAPYLSISWGFLYLFVFGFIMIFSLKNFMLPLSPTKKTKVFGISLIIFQFLIAISFSFLSISWSYENNTSKGNPFAPIIILSSLIIYTIVLFWYHKIDRQLPEIFKISADYIKWKNLGIAFELLLFSIIMTVVDFLLVVEFNTYIAVLGWIITPLSYYFFENGN